MSAPAEGAIVPKGFQDLARCRESVWEGRMVVLLVPDEGYEPARETAPTADNNVQRLQGDSGVPRGPWQQHAVRWRYIGGGLSASARLWCPLGPSTSLRPDTFGALSRIDFVRKNQRIHSVSRRHREASAALTSGALARVM